MTESFIRVSSIYDLTPPQTRDNLHKGFDREWHVDATVRDLDRCGLGKVRLAQRVHDLSDRKVAPMVFCKALRDTVGVAEVPRRSNGSSEWLKRADFDFAPR